MPYEDGRRNTVDPKDLNGICPTCKAIVPGSVDGVIKHTRKFHPDQVPKITIRQES